MVPHKGNSVSSLVATSLSTDFLRVLLSCQRRKSGIATYDIMAAKNCYEGAAMMNVATLSQCTCLRSLAVEMYAFGSTGFCPTLTAPKSGRVRWTGTSQNSVARYSCYSGYILSGESTRTCLSTRVWSGSAPVCERKWATWVHFEQVNLPKKCFGSGWKFF